MFRFSLGKSITRYNASSYNRHAIQFTGLFLSPTINIMVFLTYGQLSRAIKVGQNILKGPLALLIAFVFWPMYLSKVYAIGPSRKKGELFFFHVTNQASSYVIAFSRDYLSSFIIPL